MCIILFGIYPEMINENDKISSNKNYQYNARCPTCTFTDVYGRPLSTSFS